MAIVKVEVRMRKEAREKKKFRKEKGGWGNPIIKRLCTQSFREPYTNINILTK